MIGALSVFIPIPYTILIYAFGSLLNPLLVGLFAGAGSAIGEISGYLLGYFGRVAINEEKQKKMDSFMRIFSRRGGLAIFIFALTPLPDDLLFIPLGIMHYNFFKAFVPCIIGKTLMSLALAYAGYFSVGFIEGIFSGYGGWLTTIVTFVILVVVIYLMGKIDWDKLSARFP